MTFGRAPAAVVIDASVAVEFLGGNPEWLERWAEWTRRGDLLLAPAHLGPETANALLRGVRLEVADAAARLERLFASGVELTDRGFVGLSEALRLANDHGLTVYDALYLQLALDLAGELATLDTDLAIAARAEGVALVS